MSILTLLAAVTEISGGANELKIDDGSLGWWQLVVNVLICFLSLVAIIISVVMAWRQNEIAKLENKKSYALVQPVFKLKLAKCDYFYSIGCEFLDSKIAPLIIMYSNNQSRWIDATPFRDFFVLSPMIEDDGYGDPIQNEYILKPSAGDNIRIKIEYYDRFFQPQWQEFKVSENGECIPVDASFAVKK